jgi:hypothetical protein
MTSTDLMNVEAFANKLPSTAFAGLNPESENLADGIGSSYGIVGYKGKVWTLRLRGETYTFTRPDDGSPAAFLDAIILRSASYKSKSYYPANSFNDNSAGERPICSALDGVNPDRDAQQPQAQACALCPRNEWKMVGDRKGRECSDYKRLAVLILPSQSRALLGSPLMEPVFLRVPAASLNDLAILGEAMSKKGFHYSTYITRIGFQVDKPHPQMTFRALQALTDKEAPIVLPMREDPQAYRITGENEVGKQQPAAQRIASSVNGSNGSNGSNTAQGSPSSGNSAVKPTTSTSSPQTTTSPSEDDEEAKLLAQLEAARKKKQAAAAQPQPEPTGPVDTGFGGGEVVGLGTNQPVIDAAPSTAPSDEDTGPAEDADLDLDARVAGLLQR